MDWLLSYIIWDGLRRKEKSMPPTITKKDWKGYDEKTKERFRAAGIDLDEQLNDVENQLEKIAEQHRNVPTRGITVTGGVVYPRVTLKNVHKATTISSLVGWTLIAIGFTVSLVGTGIHALGRWLFQVGDRMRYK